MNIRATPTCCGAPSQPDRWDHEAEPLTYATLATQITARGTHRDEIPPERRPTLLPPSAQRQQQRSAYRPTPGRATYLATRRAVPHPTSDRVLARARQGMEGLDAFAQGPQPQPEEDPRFASGPP